ncbi:MAG: hypothetical protein J0G95_03520 [Rhizobiales bacterium]|nr:hypothetical protein [Hyphomicrobiales bacterium]
MDARHKAGHDEFLIFSEPNPFWRVTELVILKALTAVMGPGLRRDDQLGSERP